MKYIYAGLLLILSLSTTYAKNNQNVTDSTSCDTAKRKLPILPFIFYAPETSLGFTLNYVKSFEHGCGVNDRTSSLILTGLYTLKNQWAVRGTYNGFYQEHGYVTLNTFSVGENNGYYYGVGTEAADAGEEEYYKTFEGFYEHALMKQVGSTPFYAGYGMKLMYVSFNETDDNVFVNNSLIGPNGANGGWNNGIGLSLMLDTRDNNMFPTSGVLLKSRYLYYNKLMGSDFQYDKFTLSTSWYKKLTHNSVFAANMSMEHNGEDVPFFDMAGMSLESNIRGYYRGRPRDRDMAMFQAEYRRKLGKKQRWRMAVFGGASCFGSYEEEYTVSQPFFMGGVGLRIPLTKDGFTFRIDLAFGSYSRSVYAGAGEAF